MGVYRCIICLFFFSIRGDSVISSRDAHDDVTFCVIRLATDKEGQSVKGVKRNLDSLR